ncbi:inositol 1,4,5-triphosphate receptor associated 2-like [Salvelinus fontinalis]|uniref:inositol 1,4,5-triphosphate receptor associated 2-like n=1 Tax=Salvelinus fontinalis TaxID=8038 RepID=UPI002486A23A|nr:inositol 1,4,5-triphosphate receptor associated 2-like [Salvelinus fontinalis]
MASENLLNGGQSFHGEKSQSYLLSSHGENHESSRPSTQTRPMRDDRRGYIARALSRDSGVSFIKPYQVPDSNEMWSSYGPEDSTEESVDTSTFSEEELLDITFEACNTTGTGEVLASTIMQYLQTMTSQSPEQDRLNALNRMLDPECRDPTISRAKFQSTMREWIAQCSQDGMHEDDKHISGESPCKASLNGPEIKTAFSEGEQCYCDSRELLATVSELKHAHSRMSKQNNSLLRTVSQGEDTNLQLTVEITELSALLASAQRSARRTRSLVEELEDARRSLREAQERASQAQTSSCKLSKECDCLKAHIKVLEDKNEQLTLEGTCSEDCLNKLRKVHAEMREELEETLVMLAVRDRELTKKGILMDKLKNSHLENHRIIEVSS